jgi:hypothetical protein
MNENVSKEYKRLKGLFKDVDESKTSLIDELLKKAAFLKVELDDLEYNIRKYGAIQRSNKGNVRESIYYKSYLSTVNVYQGIIKTLNTIMGKNVIDGDDDFDEFLRRANG